MRCIEQSVAAPFVVTDEEHVQRVRRAVAIYDRWRRPLLAFYAALVIAFIGLSIAVAQVLQGFLQLGNPQGMVPGFLVGLALGAAIGGLALKIGHGLVAALTPLRTERLLLHYYDALTELTQVSSKKNFD